MYVYEIFTKYTSNIYTFITNKVFLIFFYSMNTCNDITVKTNNGSYSH